MKTYLISLSALFLFMSCKAQDNKKWEINPDNNTLFWKVSGKDLKKPSFLFGTFHLLCSQDIHISDPLKEAIRAVDTIYMEMDMDDPTVMLSGMMYMNMKDGKTLKDLYTPEEYKRLESYFSDSLKMPMMLFQKAKPYFLVALLYPRMMDCATPSGVEQEIIKIAKKEKKEINGLETMQLQASVFDSIPYVWQAQELLKNIDSFPKYKKEFDEMVQMYKSQNMDSLEKAINKSEFGGDEFSEVLLFNRNRNWVKQLNSMMKNQSVLVAVGAGHLPGKDGLIDLLRKAGYTVEPLKNN
ncbi:MAG: TraB/GumN family protein [Ginsengibacter sp.]